MASTQKSSSLLTLLKTLQKNNKTDWVIYNNDSHLNDISVDTSSCQSFVYPFTDDLQMQMLLSDDLYLIRLTNLIYPSIKSSPIESIIKIHCGYDASDPSTVVCLYSHSKTMSEEMQELINYFAKTSQSPGHLETDLLLLGFLPLNIFHVKSDNLDKYVDLLLFAAKNRKNIVLQPKFEETQ